VVRELLAAGADPLLREDGGHGRTALEWAEAGGHRTTVDLLSGFAPDRPDGVRRS
jgi:hypothetical protein